MKKILAVTLAVLMALSLVACTGGSGDVDNINEYTPEQRELITEDGTFTFEEGLADTSVLVSYVGKATHDDKVSIPAEFNERPVATIGKEAFYQLASVVEVEIPSTVVSIEESAFAYCVNLKKITWKDAENDKVSDGNALPEGLETIGKGAFMGCTSLTDLDLGKSLKSIGDFAFLDCDNLTAAVLPDTTRTIGNAAFWRCKSLTEFDTNGVTKIGNMALYDCVAIQKITLSNVIEEIGEAAFHTAESSLKDKIDVDSFAENDYVKKYYEEEIAEPSDED